MTGRLAAWPFHAILAAGAAVCWSTAAAWVAAVLTGLLAALGAAMEAIARRHRSRPAIAVRGEIVPGTVRKALTAGAVITERKGSGS